MNTAIEKLNKIIKKARMEFYKPIQVAEVLYQDRTSGERISGNDLESYRIQSRAWRDEVTLRLFGKKATSSARYQDDVWSEHAVPPWAITELLQMNRKDASVERHIYTKVGEQWSDFLAVRDLINAEPSEGQLSDILSGTWSTSPSSTDRVVEILVVCLLNAELRCMQPMRLIETASFDISSPLGPIVESVRSSELNFARLGHTNAADAGLDIWSNFGVVVSVKNRKLTDELFESVIDETPVGDLLVVCREVGEGLDEIAAVSDRAISVVTLSTLMSRANYLFEAEELRSLFANDLQSNFEKEFPQAITFPEFMRERAY